MNSTTRTIIVLALFVATFFGMRFFSDVKPTPILQALSGFPQEIDGWKLSRKGSLSQGASDMLGVDDYIDYTYANSRGAQISLYASYFSALGVSGLYHSPQNCMPGGGWNIQSVEKIPMQYLGKTVKINKMTVVNGSSRMLVYYWFQNRGRIIASEYWDKIYTVIDGVFMRRRDGSFIRVISVGSDEPAAIAFSQKTAAALNNYLPGR